MKNIVVDSLKVTSAIKLKDRPTYINVETSEKKKEKELQKIRDEYQSGDYGTLEQYLSKD